MEKKESLVIVNLIFSHAELRRIHCRYSLEDYNRNVKWHNNQFHLPYDLSKEIRDNVFLSSNRGNQSQIRKTKNNRGPAYVISVCSYPSWSASFPQDFAPFGWLLTPNPIKELHEQQWFWSLLTIPILTLERSLRSLKALNPSLLQLCCKEELLPINFWRVVWNTGAIQFCIFSELVDICCLRPVVYLHLLIPYSFVSL